MTTTSTIALRGTRPRTPLGRLLLTGLAAAGLATLLTLLAYALGRSVTGDLVVSPPGQPTGPVPTAAVVGAALAGSVLAVVLALLLRALPIDRPRRWFLGIGVAGLLLSFASPAGAAQDAATALWLSALHVTVAAPVLLLLARALPGGPR